METRPTPVSLFHPSASLSTEAVNGFDGHSSAMHQDTHRASAPTIPSDLAQSFSRSRTLSSASYQSTPFLSPPISEPWTQSPPPRPEADDYLSAKGRHLRRRRLQHRHTRKRRTHREEGSGLHHAYEQNEEAQSPTCEGRESSRLVKTDVPQRPSLQTSPEELKPRREHTPQRQLSNRNASFHGADFAQISSQSNSPAAQALKKLSQCDVRALDAKAGPFRRASLAIASSLGLAILEENDSEHSSTNIAPVEESIDGGQLTKQKTNESGIGWEAFMGMRKADRQSHQRSNTTTLKRPSTILLRKATSVHQISAREDMNTPNSPQASQRSAGETRITPPTVELIAFYSEHKSAPLDQGERSISTESRPLAASLSLTHLGRLGGMTRRQSSNAAELALTYSDVHIAPGTFSTTVKPPARSLSLEAFGLSSASVGNISPGGRNGSGMIEATPRICGVQLRTPTTVHEIIWREDETTSGSSISCSTAGSASPARATQFDTIGGGGGGGGASDDGRGHVDREEGGDGDREEVVEGGGSGRAPDGGGGVSPPAERDDCGKRDGEA